MTTHAYLRVSTKSQTLSNQRLKISEVFVVDEWHEEHAVSGKMQALKRPVFSELEKITKEGDTVIAVSLDRLGRDTEDVLHTIRMFREKGVHLRLMDLDGVDLTSTTGKILVTLLSLVAELERDKCIERYEAGVNRARDQNKAFGRYLKINPDVLKQLYEDRQTGMTFQALQDKHNLDKNTICQTLKKWGNDFEGYKTTWDKQRKQAIEKAEKMLKKAAQ